MNMYTVLFICQIYVCVHIQIFYVNTKFYRVVQKVSPLLFTVTLKLAQKLDKIWCVA